MCVCLCRVYLKLNRTQEVKDESFQSELDSRQGCQQNIHYIKKNKRLVDTEEWVRRLSFPWDQQKEKKKKNATLQRESKEENWLDNDGGSIKRKKKFPKQINNL